MNMEMDEIMMLTNMMNVTKINTENKGLTMSEPHVKLKDKMSIALVADKNYKLVGEKWRRVY